jgi:hypothetical protein
MNKIPKYRVKYFVSQQNNSKISQKESYKEHIPPKITQRNLKLSGNRNFGRDITNSIKNSNQNMYNNRSTIISEIERKSNNIINVQKHCSANQVTQKIEEIKIITNGNKLRENKSGSSVHNKKNDISNIKVKEVNKKRNSRRANGVHIASSQLNNSISFGINNTNKIISGNIIYGKIPNQKYSKININKTNINNGNNNKISLCNNNSKNDTNTSNMDLL